MKRLIIWLFLASFGVSVNAGDCASLMELPPFERAVLIIKYYESLYRPEHWPAIGYGHMVQSGEPYKKGMQLNERQADALLRKDLRKFCSMYRSFGADSLLLACVSYNCGPAKIIGGQGYTKSSLIQKLESGNRNILADYLSFCHYQGKLHQGIRRRRWVEYQMLFKP